MQPLQNALILQLLTATGTHNVYDIVHVSTLRGSGFSVCYLVNGDEESRTVILKVRRQASGKIEVTVTHAKQPAQLYTLDVNSAGLIAATAV